MTFGKLTWVNSVTKKPEKYEKDTPLGRRLDLVTISKDGTVTGIEVKATEEEAQRKRSREQEARDNNALERKGQIRDQKDDQKLYTPTSVVRFVGNPPDCDDPDHREKHDKQRRPAAVKNVRVDTDPNSQEDPVESEKDPQVDVERRGKPKPRNNINPSPPRFNVPARPPAVGNVEPPEPPKTNPPVRPPVGNVEPPRTEPPKTNLPVRPPATEPPKINPPVRPPVRPPALSGALNIGSKIARPLGLVTDVIDLKNAYDEDGGFGKNFQETAGGVAGGWGGAAAGAAAGAALGSVVPGFGTVAGGIVGGVIGGIGGSAAGEGIVKGVRDFFG